MPRDESPDSRHRHTIFRVPRIISAAALVAAAVQVILLGWYYYLPGSDWIPPVAFLLGLLIAGSLLVLRWKNPVRRFEFISDSLSPSRGENDLIRDYDHLLAERERRFLAIADAVDDPFFTLDPDLRVSALYGKWAEKLNLEKGSIIGRRIDELTDPESVRPHLEAADRILRPPFNPARYPYRYEATHIIGETTRHFQFSILPIFDRSGGVECLAGIAHDITGLKQVERELRLERDRIQRFLDVSGVIVVELDMRGRTLLINKTGCEIIGLPESEIIGRNWFNTFFPSEIRAQFKATFRRIVEHELPPKEIAEPIEAPLITAGGERRIILWRNVVLTDPEGYFISAISAGNDITDMRRAEQKHDEAVALAERSARLASIGVMAAGITHEINQPLNAIKINADSLLYWERQNPGELPGYFIEQIRDISSGVERIDRIIQHMRSYWISSVPGELEEVELNHAVKSALSLVTRRIFDHGITPEVVLAERELVILGRKINLEQIVINLVTNAVNALDQVERKEKRVRVLTRKENGKIFLEVHDNGPGIPLEKRKALFDPFITTGKDGMGMGMAIVSMFVERFHGNIEIETNESQGASFIIDFPEKRTDSGEVR